MYWHRPQTGVLDVWCVFDGHVCGYVLIDTLEWRSKFWIGLIEKRRPFITFCSLFYLALPCRSLQPYNWTEYLDLSTFCHMYRWSLRKELLSLTACWCWDSSGDRVGNDSNINNNNSDDNENRLCSFLCHITHTNSTLHVTQFVTFLLHA